MHNKLVKYKKLQKLTTEIFILRSIIVHKGKYSYDKVNYIGNNKNVIISCNTCNTEFEQLPCHHLVGHGCKKCADIKLSHSKEIFIEKANEVHNNFYSYDNVDYKGSRQKVFITCPVHGDFQVIPATHLSGNICRKCANLKISKRLKENPNGWNCTNWEKAALRSKYFDSYKVYIIECYNNEEKFIKIGRTFNTIERRFLTKENMPYNYIVLKTILFEIPSGAFKEEMELKRKFKEFKYLPNIEFGGKHECFNILIKNKIVNE